MEFIYLGTAVAEGFPALFCNCEYCKAAREKGGKNIRTRSQAIIDGDLLIDFPSDTYMHALNNKFELHKVKTLIITHGHEDHFYSKDLLMRKDCFAHDMDVEILQIYCSEYVLKRFIHEVGSSNIKGINFNVFKAFETFSAGEYKITPLPARHMFEEDAYIFIIEKQGKKILYANDTGYFYQETFDYIKNNSIYFNFVSYDCTNVTIPIDDNGTHMGFENISRVSKALKDMKSIDSNTIEFVTHFSHNGNPCHKRLVELAKPLNMGVAFDGCKVII